MVREWLIGMVVVGCVLLGGCAGLDTGGMPPNMPIAGHKFAGIRKGMTYAEFERQFGAGWEPGASGTDSKYWFFDDGRTVAVPAESWRVPPSPLKYRVIGSAPVAVRVALPILPSPNDIQVTTRRGM